ncbi:MAG: HD-GYP domain-containing protein [Acidobacteria bacterium]|nr:HD-GYP domain-containing protein [Acidobacteriota bacterium]MCB9377135.1 HD-GYP domain-containing protein [Holophagales bacterium]
MGTLEDSRAADSGAAEQRGWTTAARAAAIVVLTAFTFKLLSDFSAQFSEAWGASYVFPPAGLALAVGAAYGLWGVLGVVAGVFLSPWGAATTPATLAVFAVVNAVAAAIPARLLRDPRGPSSRRLLRVGLYGLVLNNLASAVLGTAALVWLGRLPPRLGMMSEGLLTWWVSDAVAGLLLGFPLLLLLAPQVLLDEDFRRLERAWRGDGRKLATFATLLVLAIGTIQVLALLRWDYPQWGAVLLVVPLGVAALQGGLGGAIWACLPTSLAYLALTILPILRDDRIPPREVVVPAYAVLVFFAAFGIVGGYLAGRNRHLLDRIQSQQRQLERDFERTVRSLAAAIEAKDRTTIGHVQRVADLAVRVGEELDMDDVELTRLRYAALLHDVGKIGVPEAVLNKPGPLDPGETAVMQQHVEIGLKILGSIDVLRDVLPLVEYHQERWDGRRDGVTYPGYFGLSGEAIPLGARVLAVVDAFDAMTNDRPYRTAGGLDDALEELRREAGAQFDPRIVDVVRRLVSAEGPNPRSRRYRSQASSSDNGDPLAGGAARPSAPV